MLCQMPATSTCLAPSCRTSVEGEVALCPVCGGRMRTPRDVRRAGWLLAVLGLFLTGFIGWIALATAPSLLRPGVEIEGATFTGTAEQARMIFTLFGAVIVFALGIIANGVVQIATGARHRPLTVATLALAGLLMVYALVTTSALA
jgi:hypothetical protein